MTSFSSETRIALLEKETQHLRGRIELQEKEMLQLKDQVALFSSNSTLLNKKLDTIINAVTGDNLGNKGLHNRLTEIESFSVRLESEFEKFQVVIEKKKAWILGAFAATSFLAGFFVWLISWLIDLFTK